MMATTLYPSRLRNLVPIVFCLCVCVLVQMLGVPATLLSPADSPDDLLGSSVSEGFSVIPPFPDIYVPADSVAAPAFSFFSHVPVIASALFHPPLR